MSRMEKNGGGFGSDLKLSPNKSAPLLLGNEDGQSEYYGRSSRASTSSPLGNQRTHDGGYSQKMNILRLKLTVQCAMDLIPANKLTSNARCECYLIHRKKPKTLRKWRTNVVKSSLNPIWNRTLDLGTIDTTQVDEIGILIKHVSTLGLANQDLGRVNISTQELTSKQYSGVSNHRFQIESTKEMKKSKMIHKSLGYLEIQLDIGSSENLAPIQPMVIDGPENSHQSSEATKNQNSNAHRSARKSKKTVPEVPHDAEKELQVIQSFDKQEINPGETWCLIEAGWIKQWLVYVSQRNKIRKSVSPPGPVTNMLLIENELNSAGCLQLQKDLLLRVDYRLITEASMRKYLEWYGGGPLIQVHIPKEYKGELVLDSNKFLKERRSVLHTLANIMNE